MQRVQIVSKYLTLAEDGFVPKINCPMDQGPLMPNLSNQDEIYLYCLSCNYKKTIGTEYYEKLKEHVDKN